MAGWCWDAAKGMAYIHTYVPLLNCISFTDPLTPPSPSSQSNLELSQQECLALKYQLKVQRERAAAALNKIHRQYVEESGRLRQDKASLEQETEQAKASLLHKERTLNAAMATKMELQVEIQRMNEEKNEIKRELRKEVCVGCVHVCVECLCVCARVCICVHTYVRVLTVGVMKRRASVYKHLRMHFCHSLNSL